MPLFDLILVVFLLLGEFRPELHGVDRYDVVVFTANICDEVLHKLVNVARDFLAVDDEVGVRNKMTDLGLEPDVIGLVLI